MVPRILLLIILFASITSANAQVGTPPVKTTEKQADAQIDYNIPGTSMPDIRFIVYQDTSLKRRQDMTEGNNGHKRKKEAGKAVNSELSKKVLTNKDLKNGANLLVMIFNPNCSHCQEETIMIGHHKELFKKTKMVMMVNPIMQMYMGDFVKFTHLEEYPFMYLGVDSADYIKKVFLYQALPQLNIYDKHQKLIRTFSGEVAIDSIKKYIQ